MESRGDSTLLSAPPGCIPDSVGVDDAETTNMDYKEDSSAGPVPNDFIVCEFFAGSAALTQAVMAAGVQVRQPDDLETKGADFTQKSSVDAILCELGELAVSGVQLIVHFAPPCVTFSKARDRHPDTRLRSLVFPQGLPRCSHKTAQAYLVARHALDLAEALVRDYGAYVSMENPESSYMWAYLDPALDLGFQDVVFTPCLFGADYLKPTRLRCWNWVPASLTGMRCTRKGGYSRADASHTKPSSLAVDPRTLRPSTFLTCAAVGRPTLPL